MNPINVGNARGLVNNLTGHYLGGLADESNVQTAARDDLAAVVAANRAELERLNAKPVRGSCPMCLHLLWCADSEDEAVLLVAAHIADRHTPAPMVWRIK